MCRARLDLQSRLNDGSRMPLNRMNIPGVRMYVTPKRCPKCRYERQAADTAPDWQCPSCGIAYSKAEQTLQAVPTAVLTTRAPAASRPGGAGRWIALALAIVGAVLLFARPWAGAGSDSAPATIAAASAEQPEVVMYATSWCPYCAKARSFFQRHGIRYVEHDVERDRDAWREQRRLGGRGVPTIVVGDEVIHGYDEGRLGQLLDPWMN
jgi:glutaredoxin